MRALPSKFQFRLLCGMLAITLSLNAAATEKIRVLVDVQIGDSPLHDRFVSALNRELRRLDDVSVVDDKADFEILILSILSKNKGGDVTGFSAAVEFLKPVDLTEVTSHTLEKYQRVDDAEQDPTLVTFGFVVADFGEWSNSKLNLGLFLHEGSIDDVESYARDLIAHFDSQVLLKQRKWLELRREFAGHKKASDKTSQQKPKPK